MDVISELLEQENTREEDVNRESELLQASFDSLIFNDAFQHIMLHILEQSTLLTKSLSNEDEGKKDIGRLLCNSLILSSEESFDMIIKRLTKRSFSGGNKGNYKSD